MSAPVWPFDLHPALVTGAAALVLVYAAVGVVRAYALHRGVLDLPTARGSHTRPTPRGGGLGLVAGVLAAAVPALAHAGVPGTPLVAAVLAVLLVAAVGWVDDHRGAGVGARLAIHAAAAALVAGLAFAAAARGAAIWAHADGVVVRGAGSAAVVGACAWWAFWTVSAINVVNFMDGIDGIIGAQLAVFGLYAVTIGGPPAAPPVLLGSALCAGAVGFLAWNWSPARIFLGDVGSGAAGVLVVVLGLTMVVWADVSVPRAFLPLYPLFLDAAVTLVRRRRSGERITTPHRSHLYQRLANGPWSHARTAAVYAAAAGVGALVGWIGGRAPLVIGATLALAYVAAVPALGRLLERRAPWHAPRLAAG